MLAGLTVQEQQAAPDSRARRGLDRPGVCKDLRGVCPTLFSEAVPGVKQRLTVSGTREGDMETGSNLTLPSGTVTTAILNKFRALRAKTRGAAGCSSNSVCRPPPRLSASLRSRHSSAPDCPCRVTHTQCAMFTSSIYFFLERWYPVHTALHFPFVT